MPAMRVVPAFDEVEDSERSLTMCFEGMLHEKLTFERCIEAFAHRIVMGVAKLGPLMASRLLRGNGRQRRSMCTDSLGRDDG